VGKSFGAIGIIDTRTDSAVDEIRLDAFPKQFELERAGKRVFVNVPSLNQVAVLDRGTGKQFASWPLAGATGNVPMALDEPDRRLLIGCEPGAFIVLDTETGRPVAHLGIAAKPDGVYLDARRRLIYVSCGTGFIEVIRQLDADHYAPMRAIPTSPGAATSLWVPQLDRLFLGVPQQGDRPASIRVYCPVR
jgi:hypothetical protein